MSFFASFIPPTPGLLPKWQLLVAAFAVFNTVQNFVTLKFTKRIYNTAPAVTALQARTFAIWTLTSAIVRFYAAYHITDKLVYDMTLFTYLLAFGHFSSELLIFRTARVNPGVISPVIVASESLSSPLSFSPSLLFTLSPGTPILRISGFSDYFCSDLLDLDGFPIRLLRALITSVLVNLPKYIYQNSIDILFGFFTGSLILHNAIIFVLLVVLERPRKAIEFTAKHLKSKKKNSII
ncbi:Erg28 like protein-domain-containing protein [Phellopilus nigrolimitatus]|nr:Erg28 like protein-domain-containing protein [Phellopilus nigrolimitatus]